MIEVRPGVLVGSMGDALAVFSRARSVTKQYSVTHVLTLTNEPPDWSTTRSLAGGGGSNDGISTTDTAKQGQSDGGASVKGDGGASVKGEGGASVKGEGGAQSMKKVGGDTEDVAEKSKDKEAMRTMYVRVADMPSSDLLHHFEPCCQFIKQGVQQGAVLVHCEYGISRSATIVLAYLMWSEGLPYNMVYKDLKERKPEIRPNSGFVEQLKLWGAMRCRIDTSNKEYKAYRLKHLAREMKNTGCVEDMVMSPDPFTNELESNAYFKCRKCRRLLFTDESVLQHEVGKGQAAFKWHKRSPHAPTTNLVDEKQEETAQEDPPVASHEEPSPLSGETEAPSSPQSPSVAAELAEVRAQVTTVVSLGSKSTSPQRCSSHFVEPVEWMASFILGSVEGKILCPKCSAKVGSFNWAGDQCSCGQWVTPSLQIHKNKLDETRTLVRRKNASKST